MDETKIEQVEATPEVETVEAPAEVEVEAQEAEAVEAPAEEVAEAPAEEVVAEPVAEGLVAEGCTCGKCESCKAKKESEDDQDEKKVVVKEGVQAEHQANQRKEVAKEQSKDLVERMEDAAAEKVAEIVAEAIAELPIVEGMTEDEDNARKEEIMEDGERLLADVYAVLEEMVNGTTFELNGHQAEVKDFVQTGGKVSQGLPAGINPPSKSEDDESEKKVHIKAYHEGAEEIDYKAKYAESEANMDTLVSMIEETAAKYTKLVEEYNEVVEQLQAYKISEAYSITVDDAAEMLKEHSFDQVCEAIEAYDNEQMAIAEGCEEKAEDVEDEKAEEKEDKKEEKEEEKAEKAMEEIKESVDLENTVIEEAVEAPRKTKVFSVFNTSESKTEIRPRKAFSVFAD